MTRLSMPGVGKGLPIVLALGVCLSVAALTRFGYQAISQWQQSSSLLSIRRAGVTADLFVKALRRDMEAVQSGVLVSPNWDDYVLDSPYELRSIVASAFARYPYPETFFATRQSGAPASYVFFNRADRIPRWSTAPHPPARFPVTIDSDAATARAFSERIARDAQLGRRFSIFEVDLAGGRYQVVAHLLYRDPLRQQLSGLLGFTIDLEWARQHYFAELTQQVGKVSSIRDGFGLYVIDDDNRLVASSVPARFGRTTARRPFRLMFFDPSLVALDPPAELRTVADWAVEVEDLSDPPLNLAVQSASRTLIIASISAVTLAIGLLLTARATRAHARLTEMRADFVSAVTHDLKTPLASIRAAGDTLVSGRFTNADGPRDYAGLIVEESKRLARLVDNLLAYARITDVTEVYSFEELSLATVIFEALKRFDATLTQRGFEVRTDIAPDLPDVRADHTAMELLLDNLIDNAIRYSSTTRRLTIGTRDSPDTCTIEIADSGDGIPADQIKNVTRRFYRGAHAVSGGSGLGLAIANRIAVDHGGRLTIASEVGRGTTVTVVLPRHQKST